MSLLAQLRHDPPALDFGALITYFMSFSVRNVLATKVPEWK